MKIAPTISIRLWGQYRITSPILVLFVLAMQIPIRTMQDFGMSLDFSRYVTTKIELMSSALDLPT